MHPYTIRHRNGTILHEGEAASLKAFVEKHKTNLRYADLSGAYLSYAYLSYADLSCADLSGADLSGADLGGAYLGGADLRGAYLGGVKLNGLVIDGSRDRMVAFTHDNEHYLNIGCVSHPLGCWQEHYKKIGRMHQYTKGQIEEYGLHIEHCARILKLMAEEHKTEEGA